MAHTGTETHVPLTQAQADALLAKSEMNAVFNSYDIRSLLNTSGALGIRTYHAIKDGKDTAMAVAVGKTTLNGEMSDDYLVDLHNSKHYYLRSDGNDLSKYATRMATATAKEYLKYPQGSKEKYHVYFSKDSLNNILAKDVDGIRFYDASHDGYSSMMMVGVKDGGKAGAVDLKGDGEYVLSDRHCPPYCPTNGGKALFSAGT